MPHPPKGYVIYDGPPDWRFLPAGMFYCPDLRLWAQVSNKDQLGAFATPHGINAIPCPTASQEQSN